jgi:4'-phosphopantetheinyl transferase
MPLARWAFNIRQPLLLENVEPLVTRLTDDDTHSSDSSSQRPPNIVPVSNLLNFLPKSEADSLLQLRLEDDMRRALVGRLMIHAFFTAHHNCQWENLVFDNTESTKPVLVCQQHQI